jgi:hypothetical protein
MRALWRNLSRGTTATVAFIESVLQLDMRESSRFASLRGRPFPTCNPRSELTDISQDCLRLDGTLRKYSRRTAFQDDTAKGSERIARQAYRRDAFRYPALNAHCDQYAQLPRPSSGRSEACFQSRFGPTGNPRRMRASRQIFCPYWSCDSRRKRLKLPIRCRYNNKVSGRLARRPISANRKYRSMSS